MIELRHVWKTFTTNRGSTAALADVSLTIARGELLCLVGPSGCGKTTILNLIAGLERPDRGEVLANGRPVEGPGPDRGVIFQDAALFPWLSVADNVEFGLKELRLPKPERKERVRKYLALVDMARFGKAYVHELSGGMRQRAALARALAMGPEILLMDEPFGALDARTRETLQAELVTIWKATGKTVVFVTHDMAEAVRLGSRVVVLKARPARVSQMVELESRIPRPRTVEDPHVIALAAELKRGLQDQDENELEAELHAHEDRSAEATEGEEAAPAGADRAPGVPPHLGVHL